MRSHLYEVRFEKKKLTCLCGWERSLKTTDPRMVREAFAKHCLEAALKPS